MGPRGYNGSQGRAGVPGPAGQPGRPGVGNVSACHYKNKSKIAQSSGKETELEVLLREDTHRVITAFSL